MISWAIRVMDLLIAISSIMIFFSCSSIASTS
jgi:hypothetical protein